MRVLLRSLSILLVLLRQLPEQSLWVERLLRRELVVIGRREIREEGEESLGDGEGRKESGRVWVVGK